MSQDSANSREVADDFCKGGKAAHVSRTSFTLCPRHVYLRILLETASSGTGGFVDIKEVETLISDALVDAYGAAGCASLPVLVTDFRQSDGSAVLRTPASCLQKVWTALTLISKARGQPARIVVTRASPFLLALSRRDS